MSKKKVVISLSGGKNSTYALYLYSLLLDFFEVECVTYIPYFNDDIPLIPKSSFNFLYALRDRFQPLGIKFNFVKGITYKDWVLTINKKGKRKGLLRSYPFFGRGKCGFARDSKIRSVSSFISNLHYDFLDIGLCADEIYRKKLVGNEISILRIFNIKDSDCISLCSSQSLLNPIYSSSIRRDGCLLCPHGSNENRLIWFNDYPAAFSELLSLQYILKDSNFYPLRNKRYFIENSDFQCGGGFSRFSFFDDFVIN